MHEKETSYRRRIPIGLKTLGSRRRTLHDTFERALAVTATMDAERHSMLSIAFSFVFEVPQAKFEFALRRHKRGQTLHQAAAQLAALGRPDGPQ